MNFKKLKTFLFLTLFLSGPAFLSASGQAQEIETGESTFVPPPRIEELRWLEVDEDDAPVKEGVGLDIRIDAMKEAALSYGARGGLAHRTWEIRKQLEDKTRYLDKVFNFRQLLIDAPSGFLIEPPDITEAEDNMLMGSGGMEAAVADRFLNINTNVRIVTAPRNWRQYLEREWGEVDPPPNILRPVTDEEREIWIEQIDIGWREGVEQANEIFESDLNLLLAHYRGMVRYRVLLAEGMVTPTLAVQTDRGVTGGGNQMRIGDRAVQIVDKPEFVPESAEWSTVNR